MRRFNTKSTPAGQTNLQLSSKDYSKQINNSLAKCSSSNSRRLNTLNSRKLWKAI